MFDTRINSWGLIVAIVCTDSAMAGMNGLTVDHIANDLADGAYTVRLYAELDAGNRLDAVFGNDSMNMVLTYLDGASSYHDMLGGPTSQSINTDFPTPPGSHLEWDSYFTIGSLYANGFPFGNNALMDIGIDWSTWDPGPGDLFADNGALFITPDDPQGEAQSGRVLIAQFTTFAGTGEWDTHLTAGFQGKDENGITWQSQHDILINAVPSPGALALLSLAGIRSRRRRRI